MIKRRRFTQQLKLEQRLAAEAACLREEAKKRSPGSKREQLLRKARQLETASNMSKWLSSPGLQPPTEDGSKLEPNSVA